MRSEAPPLPGHLDVVASSELPGVHPIVSVLEDNTPKLQKLKVAYLHLSSPDITHLHRLRQQFVFDEYRFLAGEIAYAAPFGLKIKDMRAIWDTGFDLFENGARYALARMTTAVHISQDWDRPSALLFPTLFFDTGEIPRDMRTSGNLSTMGERLYKVEYEIGMLRRQFQAPLISGHIETSRDVISRHTKDAVITENFGNGVQPLSIALYNANRFLSAHEEP